MKTLITALVCTIAVASFGVEAQARGCIKGALVGGVAGHMAHHGLMGAAAGCVVGRHMANKKATADAAAANGTVH